MIEEIFLETITPTPLYVFIPFSDMNLPKDVLIYSDTSKDPVLHISKIELSKSKLLKNLLSTLNFCDGCQEPTSIIIADEERQTVVSTFSHLSPKTGLSIFQGNS